MPKLSIIAAAFVGLVLAGSAAPAFAASFATCDDDQQMTSLTSSTDSIDSNPGDIIARLRSRGVIANAVEAWNGCIRAFVSTSNGGQTMEFFDPQSLQRLG